MIQSQLDKCTYMSIFKGPSVNQGKHLPKKENESTLTSTSQSTTKGIMGLN